MRGVSATWGKTKGVPCRRHPGKAVAVQHGRGSAHSHTGQALGRFSSQEHQHPRAGPGLGRAPGPEGRAHSRLLPQQSLYSCEEGTFSSAAGRASSASPAAVGPARPEDASCLRSMATGPGRETP